MTIIEDLPLLLPPITTQLAIVEQLTELRLAEQRLRDTYARKIAALDELKQSLLHHAFTGQLTEQTLAAHAV